MSSRQISIATNSCLPFGALAPVNPMLNPILIGSAATADGASGHCMASAVTAAKTSAYRLPFRPAQECIFSSLYQLRPEQMPEPPPRIGGLLPIRFRSGLDLAFRIGAGIIGRMNERNHRRRKRNGRKRAFASRLRGRGRCWGLRRRFRLGDAFVLIVR